MPSLKKRMFAPIAARFVLVDTEGWFWIRTVGAPRNGDPRDGEAIWARYNASVVPAP